MSDLSIPGVTDKYNTQKVIDALMAQKKVPLTRMQADLDADQQKKTAWQDANRQLSGLRDTARLLFGFQNPFNDRIASSSNDAALTATATRQAAEETKDITVKQVATSDRFASRSLPRDFTVDAGQYTFKVGDKTVALAWKGGTLKGFADALNAKGGAVLAASVVNDTTSTQVLIVQGKLTGSTNRLTFADKAVDLGVASGILTRSATASRPVGLDQGAVAAWTAPLAPDGFQVQNGTLTVNPGAELRIPVTPGCRAQQEHDPVAVGEGRTPSRAGLHGSDAAPGPDHPVLGRHRFQGHPRGELALPDSPAPFQPAAAAAECH